MLDRVANAVKLITDNAVWDKTMHEVSKGSLKGPLAAKEVPDHFQLSRRFGVVQGPTIRCVDDYTIKVVSESCCACYRVSLTAHT